MSETAENCTHNCGTCSANCGSRTSEPQSFLEKLNPASSVKKVIGVVSGKGGVGKSLVTSLMACRMRATGAKVGILDADITGPSIPNAFGIHDGVTVTPDGKLLVPATSSTGIDVISSNMLLENETDPVIWRGPVIAGAVKLPTIVFDEIDTGVSGEIADRMADMMQEMGDRNRQVISITHLPQIAARGRAHYKVYKKDSDTETNSHIRRLTDEERVEEIAHMLSGATLTEAALSNAKALLARTS